MLEQLTGLREILTFIKLVKDMVEDTDEQPDAETPGARSARVLSTGASVPVELQCLTLLACVCSPNWTRPLVLSEPHPTEILRWFSHVGMIKLLTLFHPFFPLWSTRGKLKIPSF